VAKALGKWFHDPIFDTLHPMQWKFLAQQLAIDKEEEAEEARDRAEYAMMFMNHEGVQKVRQARDAKNKKVDDNTFNKQLENLFGRGLSPEKRESIQSTEPVQTKPLEDPDIDEIKIVR
jgi:hypothetical protein